MEVIELCYPPKITAKNCITVTTPNGDVYKAFLTDNVFEELIWNAVEKNDQKKIERLFNENQTTIKSKRK